MKSLRHCATRLRCELKDEGKADTKALLALDILQVIQAIVQYQVVIGSHVGSVYEDIMKKFPAIGSDNPSSEDVSTEKKKR